MPILQPSQMGLSQGSAAPQVAPQARGNILQPSQLAPQQSQPTAATQQLQQQPQGPQLSDTGSFLGNVGNSIGNFAGAIGNAVAHPIDTVTNIGKGLIGGGENLAAYATTGKSAAENGKGDQFTAVADNIGNYIAKRYGSLSAAKQTFYNDPIGALADFSMVAGGVGGAVSKVGEFGDLGAVSDLGSGISKVGELTNPVNAVSKPLEMGINWAKTGLGNLAPSLEESSLRLTPTQKVNYANKLGDVSEYISKEIPLGNPESRYASSVSNVNNFESQMQNFLNKTAKDVTVSKADLLTQVENLKAGFAGERDALQIDSQIDGFKKLIEAKYPDEIPVANLNKLKRSTYESAFNQAGTKVSDAVEYQIGDNLRQNIEDATKGLKLGKNEDIADFNKRYGTALTAKKLLKIFDPKKLLSLSKGFSWPVL